MALSYDEYLYVERYRHQAFEAAKDLGYSTETLDGIHAAKTAGEIERLMIRARKEKFK